MGSSYNPGYDYPRLSGKVKYNTWDNFKAPKGEKNKLPSKTVPDQSMSIREILNRFAKGHPISAAIQQPTYTDEDLTEFQNLDRFEKMDLAREIRQDIKTMQEQMQNPPEEQQQNPQGEGSKTKSQEPSPGEDPASSTTKKPSEA